MPRFLLKAMQVALGCAVGVAVVASLTGCGKAEPAVARVYPEQVQPGDTLTIAGKGLADQIVKVGGVEAPVKSRGADSVLVVQVPKNLKPGSYDLVVTKEGTKVTSKPAKVLVLDMVTVPAGTPLSVRVVESISSARNHVGDTFLLALDQPLVVDGRTVAGEGSEVLGRVNQVEEGGKVKGMAAIGFTLVQLKRDQRTYPLVTGSVFSQAKGTKARDVMTIGGGAGIGAAIGGILGGKKGAAIGAGAGGAAGTGVVLATRGKVIDILTGARFSILLSQPVVVQMTGAEVAAKDR